MKASSAKELMTVCRPQGLLNIAGHPCIAYDPSGFVFAVALNLRSTIMMYDVKQFDKQPFLCVHLDDPVLLSRTFPPRVPVMTSLSFSNDGKWLLVGTSGDVHYVLDSFDGSMLARLESEYFNLCSALRLHADSVRWVHSATRSNRHRT